MHDIPTLTMLSMWLRSAATVRSRPLLATIWLTLSSLVARFLREPMAATMIPRSLLYALATLISSGIAP